MVRHVVGVPSVSGIFQETHQAILHPLGSDGPNSRIFARLIDKRTGICYDLSESFQFGGVSGSLKEPVIFRTGDIASGIANVTEGNALIVQGNVATAAGTIQVYDIQGKVVAEGFQRIDMSHLNSGVYVVKAGNTSRKVIK